MALTQEEIIQVTLSVSSYNSRVSVCPTTATIHFLQSTADAADVVDIDEWKLIGRGAPAIVQKQNKGKKEIEICVIEIGTGFIIWRDTIEPTLQYQSIRDNFHTFSKVKGEYFGFQFADQQAATSHYQEIEQAISECKTREGNNFISIIKS